MAIGKRKARVATRPWRTAVNGVRVKEEAARVYASVLPALKRVVGVLGNNQVAEVLGVAKSQPSRWLHGQPVSPHNARRIADVDYVLARALQVFYPDEAGRWLTFPQPFLGGARPLDVLVTSGAAPVIRALDQIEQGAMV